MSGILNPDAETVGGIVGWVKCLFRRHWWVERVTAAPPHTLYTVCKRCGRLQ